jgi:hypothetical protein
VPLHHTATCAPPDRLLPPSLCLSYPFSSIVCPAGDLKKRAARIVGNLCTLVNDPRDMAPYVMMLLPELKVGAGWVLGLWCCSSCGGG